MSSSQLVKMVALENQAFSLMGRLHVTMRRQSNRVTDIEYMRINPDYCRHLIELAMQSQNEDLQTIGTKLQEIYFGENGLFVVVPPKPPLFDRRKKSVEAAPNPAPSAVNGVTEEVAIPSEDTHQLAPTMEVNRAYVGSLR